MFPHELEKSLNVKNEDWRLVQEPPVLSEDVPEPREALAVQRLLLFAPYQNGSFGFHLFNALAIVWPRVLENVRFGCCPLFHMAIFTLSFEWSFIT